MSSSGYKKKEYRRASLGLKTLSATLMFVLVGALLTTVLLYDASRQDSALDPQSTSAAAAQSYGWMGSSIFGVPFAADRSNDPPINGTQDVGVPFIAQYTGDLDVAISSLCRWHDSL